MYFNFLCGKKPPLKYGHLLQFSSSQFLLQPLHIQWLSLGEILTLPHAAAVEEVADADTDDYICLDFLLLLMGIFCFPLLADNSTGYPDSTNFSPQTLLLFPPKNPTLFFPVYPKIIPTFKLLLFFFVPYQEIAWQRGFIRSQEPDIYHYWAAT